MTKTSFYLDLHSCYLGDSGVQLGFEEVPQNGSQSQHEGKYHHKHPSADPHEEVLRLADAVGNCFGPAVPVHSFLHIKLV